MMTTGGGTSVPDTGGTAVRTSGTSVPDTEKKLQQQYVESGSGGCGFLLAPAGSERTQTPEAISAEQRAFFRAAERFALERVHAHAERIERKDFAFLRQL